MERDICQKDSNPSKDEQSKVTNMPSFQRKNTPSDAVLILPLNNKVLQFSDSGNLNTINASCKTSHPGQCRINTHIFECFLKCYSTVLKYDIFHISKINPKTVRCLKFFLFKCLVYNRAITKCTFTNYNLSQLIQIFPIRSHYRYANKCKILIR